MKKLAAGNWKMNGTAAALSEVSALLAAHPAPGCEMLLCPPATLVAQMAALAAGHRPQCPKPMASTQGKVLQSR